MLLSFLFPLSKVHREVPAAEGLVRHKYVTLEAPAVRSVTLLQHHDCVPRVVVRKVDPEVCPIHV